MEVYLAVPLVAERSLERARVMATAIRDSGQIVASPWNLQPTEVSSPSVSNVFKRDMIGSETADVILADVTSPSTGVGMEVMAAYKAKRRIILVRKKGNKVSRMLEDMDGTEWVEYDTYGDLYERVVKLLRGAVE